MANATKNLAFLNGTQREYTSTVGRKKPVTITEELGEHAFVSDRVSAFHGDSLDFYDHWPEPQVIVSDGAYGILGFEGDTSDHMRLPEWYEPHVEAWSRKATPQTTLWFWNSEIGWAAVHPVLEKFGWRYVNCNIWHKGMGHIAGNVNTQKIRRFPVVTEVCAHYVFEPKIEGLALKVWLLREWKRTGLPIRKANEACGVADAAVRKYLDQGHLWYFPPAEMFLRMQEYANTHGKLEGRPYFSLDGVNPMSASDWLKMRATFNCPHGVSNVWERSALRNGERIKANGSNGKAVHFNQKPLDLMSLIIEASSDPDGVIWEPFGGLFSASVAALRLNRCAYAGEIDQTYFSYGVNRLREELAQHRLLQS